MGAKRVFKTLFCQKNGSAKSESTTRFERVTTSAFRFRKEACYHYTKPTFEIVLFYAKSVPSPKLVWYLWHGDFMKAIRRPK